MSNLTAGGFLAGIVAAALAFTAHHALPFQGHAIETVAVVVIGASMIAVGTARLALRRGIPAPPALVVLAPGDTEVRSARDEDLEFCMALHHAALEHGFFTSLGPRFLRAYHATFIDSPHAVSVVATIGGHPVGFVAGLLRPRSHTRWVLRHRGPQLALLGAVALLGRPIAGLRFVRTRVTRYVRAWRRHRAEPEGRRTHAGERPCDPAVLSHVAILPGARGNGAGQRLTETFAAAAREGGASRVALVTLEGSHGASSFYERLGWQSGALRTTPDGRSIREWTLDIAP